MTEQRCGNCRHYDPPADYPGKHDPQGACIYPLSRGLPFWVYEFAMNTVEPDDGEHCEAWEAKT